MPLPFEPSLSADEIADAFPELTVKTHLGVGGQGTVFLCRRGVDGLAKHLDRSTITKLGHWCGTPGYASPEQASARGGLTCRSDFFSLGIVAYEMALGRHPYAGNQTLVNQATSIRLPDFSEATNDLLQWITRPKSLDRPSCPEDLLTAIQKVTR